MITLSQFRRRCKRKCHLVLLMSLLQCVTRVQPVCHCWHVFVFVETAHSSLFIVIIFTVVVITVIISIQDCIMYPAENVVNFCN